MVLNAPWIYTCRTWLLLTIGAAVAGTAMSQYSRDDCCYGSSSFSHGQTVASVPSCCVYLTCHDGDIRKQYVGQPGDTGCCEFGGLMYPDGAELSAQCIALICRRGTWLLSHKIISCCKHCYLFNDPHITTFDGHYYDWHGACNYSLAQTGTSYEPDVGVFSDFRHCYNSASCLNVSTFKNDAHTVITLHHNNPFTIEVNGDDFVVPSNGVVEVRSSHGKHPVLTWREGSCTYLLGSSTLMLQHCRHRLDVWAHPTQVNSLYGLCGYFSFHREDDFTARSSTVYPLHRWPLAFPESWRTADQGYDCRPCYNCDRETTADPCRLSVVMQRQLRSICRQRLHWILAADIELGHYVDACQFDLCQLRQAGVSRNEELDWLLVLERLTQNAKIILAKTSGEGAPGPDLTRNLTEIPSPSFICLPGSRWKSECNWCRCDNTGTAALCTKKACRPGYVHPLGEDACTNGSRWRADCNLCSCLRGGFLCTRNVCDRDTPTEPSTTTTTTAPTLIKPQCFQPKDHGPCYGYFKRYAFNHATGQCEAFIYGGCSGNKNNFESLYECVNTCQ